MHHTIAGNIVPLNNIPHGEVTGDGHLLRERRHRELLPRPRHQRGRARREVGGQDVPLGHVPQQGQLQLLGLGQQGLQYGRDNRDLVQVNVLYLEQWSWKTIKSFICWRKDSYWSRKGEDVNEVSQPQHGDKDREVRIVSQ